MASRFKHYVHNITHRTPHRHSPVSGTLEPSAVSSTTRSLTQEHAKSTWHAFKLVSKNIEKFLDGTPFKLPFGALNTLIGIADAIIINRESMAILLLPIGQRLDIVSSNLARKGRPRGIDSSCERFSRVLVEAVNELKDMRSQGILKRIVKSNEHPQQLEDIFRRIDEATKNFELELTLAICREVDGITQHAEILRLRDLRPSRNARYAEVKRDGCVEGTRQGIIEDLMTWCMNDSPNCPPVYWLSGMAGTGKSTIAYTICEKLYNHGDASRRLGASFFCSRQLEAARSRQNIIPTIVHDLAHSFPDFGRALLASKFDVQPPPLKDHIHNLLSGPWRSVAANSSLPPLVVVIDALDELEGGQGSHFLEQLIREIARYPGAFQGLKFFVTSRQDPRIVDICSSLDSRAVCRLEEVPSAVIENDIHLYLCTALPALDPSTLRILAKHSSGLFIYAATAMRFIVPPSQHEMPTLKKQKEHLDLLVRAWPDQSECGVDGLLVDHLYEEILEIWLSPKSKVHQRIARAVLQTVICAEEPILVADIPRFLESELDVEGEEALNLILSLHAVLYVSENRAYSYHKSFIDFICSKGRFADQELATFLCPAPDRHLCLAVSCFRVMNLLRFNICNLPSSYLDDSQVTDLPKHVDENIPYVLRYACRHWAKHMSKVQNEKRAVEKMVMVHRKWMQNHLLFWLETMNLLKAIGECYHLLATARQWLGNNIPIEEKKDLIAIGNFVTSFGSTAMAASTPHLYISALSTCIWKSGSISRWRDRFPRIPTVVAILNEDLPISMSNLPPWPGTGTNISSVCFSPAGTHILAWAQSGVFIWEISTGELLEICVDQWSDGVTSACFSPDGKHIATGHRHSVRMWEVSTWKELKKQVVGEHSVSSVCFSANGTRVMTTGQGTAHLWDTSTWNVLHQLDAKCVVTSVCFSPDGTHIASGSWGNTAALDSYVKIWDTSNGNELHRLDVVGCGKVTSTCFSPDGMRIIIGSNNTVHIWDLSSGYEVHRMNAGCIVTSICCSPDGTQIASLSHHSVHIWDAYSGNELYRLNGGGHDIYVTSICFSPDGTWIASRSNDIIQIWDTSGKKLNQLVERDHVHSVSFSPDGTRIVSAIGTGGLTIWDMPSRQDDQQRQLAGHSAQVHSTCFSPDGKQIVSLSADHTVRIWDASTRAELHRVETKLSFLSGTTPEALFSADGASIVWDSCGQTYHWDVSTWKIRVFDHRGDVETVDSTRFSPPSKEKYRNIARLYDRLTDTLADGTRVDLLVCFSLNRNGTQVVIGATDNSVRVLDTSTWEELKRLYGHGARVNSVCFSPDGKKIVSGSSDKTIRIWDVSDTQECQCHGDIAPVRLFPDNSVHTDACPSCNPYAATWRFFDSETIRTDWCVESDEWVRSSDGERYFWLSKKMHTYLNRPDSVAISEMGSVEVDFSTGRYGQRWAECYDPSAP